MVHMLAEHLRSEFLAVPTLVRFDMAHGQEGLEPTLLIKADSLSLKYVLRRRSFRLVVTRIERELAYAVEIPDDPKNPALVWSLAERRNEIIALKSLTKNPRCVIFLFNELAVSVAWTELAVELDLTLLSALTSARLHPKSNTRDSELVGKAG